MNSMQSCTLIVDDHVASRTAMARLLGVVHPLLPACEASSLAQARTLIASRVVDLALIDFGLPDGSGLDVLRALREAQPNARAVVITRFEDDAHVFAALAEGAFGYLLKDRPEHELVAQLRRIQQGEPPLSSPVARRVLQHFTQGAPRTPQIQAGRVDARWGRRADDIGAAAPSRVGLLERMALRAPPGRPALIAEPEVSLTDRETEVLQRVGKGYTLPEIAQQLGLSRHTIADYVKQIYRKLDISSRAEAALEAARRGLVR